MRTRMRHSFARHNCTEIGLFSALLQAPKTFVRNRKDKVAWAQNGGIEFGASSFCVRALLTDLHCLIWGQYQLNCLHATQQPFEWAFRIEVWCNWQLLIPCVVFADDDLKIRISGLWNAHISGFKFFSQEPWDFWDFSVFFPKIAA